MTAQIAIRPLRLDERAAWEPLWKGYLDFYRITAPQETYDATWARLHDPNEPMWLFGGYVDGKLLGIVHYIYHRSCWTIGDYCYLQDLFVAEGARKRGLGRALIEAVYEAARAAGASRVHWLTHETNAVARSLYDTLLITMKDGPMLGESGRYARLAPVVGQLFDVPLMTRLAVGPSWAMLSPMQQQKVTDAFAHYITATYADRFDSYSGEQLQVIGEQSSGSEVIVQTRIIKATDDPVSLNYRDRKSVV